MSGCQDPWSSPIAMGLVILPGWQGDGVEGNTGPQGKIEAGGFLCQGFAVYQLPIRLSSTSNAFVPIDVVFQKQGVWKPLWETPLETQKQQKKNMWCEANYFLERFPFFFPEEKPPRDPT